MFVDVEGGNVELWRGIACALEHHWGPKWADFYATSLRENYSWFVNDEALPVIELCDLEDPYDEYCVLGGDLPPREWPMERVDARFPLKSCVRWVMYHDDSAYANGGECCALLEGDQVLGRFFLYSAQEHYVDGGSLNMPMGTKEEPWEEEDGHMGYALWVFRHGDYVYIASVGDGSENLTTYLKVSYDDYLRAWILFAGAERVLPRAKKGRAGE